MTVRNAHLAPIVGLTLDIDDAALAIFLRCPSFHSPRTIAVWVDGERIRAAQCDSPSYAVSNELFGLVGVYNGDATTEQIAEDIRATIDARKLA